MKVIKMLKSVVDKYIQHLEENIFDTIEEVNIDTNETIYAENYALANALIIYAYRFSGGDRYNLLIKRAIYLIKDKSVKPFCRLFIAHYSLISLLILPDNVRNDKYISEINEIINAHDNCDIINTNCCAMKVAIGIYKSILLNRLLPDVTKYLSMINPLSSGFINDDCSPKGIEDGMSIAYHGFTLNLLGSALCFGRKYKIFDEEIDISLYNILINGLSWWENTSTCDGSFASSGRSSYQIFTWGVNVLLGILAGHDEKVVCDRISYWLKYTNAKGGFSCTPNHFDYNLRIGYETYTHANMYNNLAVSILCIAGYLLEEDCTPIYYSIKNTSNYFIDDESGYAFFRSNTCGQSEAEIELFFACTLRNHYRARNRISSGFHFRHPQYFIPLAECGPDTANPFFEGIEYVIDDGRAYRVHNQDNEIEVTPNENGYQFILKSKHYKIIKTLSFIKNAIEWSYDCSFVVPVKQLYHYVPILLNDGKNSMSLYMPTQSTINMSMGAHAYQLACDKGLDSNIGLERYFTSPSGVCANTKIRIYLEKNQTCFKTSFFLFDNENNDFLFKQTDPYPRIRNINVNLEIEKDSLNAVAIYTLNRDDSDCVKFAWYVYKDSRHIDTVWYNDSPQLNYDITSYGNYSVRLFAKTSVGIKIAVNSNTVTYSDDIML